MNYKKREDAEACLAGAGPRKCRRPVADTPPQRREPAGRENPSPTLLEIRELSLRGFGGIVALDGVSFTIERGLDLGLIGTEWGRQDDAVQLR